MNIVFLVNRDLPANLAVNHCLPALSHHKIWLFMSSSVGKTEQPPFALRQLKFFEQQLFTELLSPLLKQTADPANTDIPKKRSGLMRSFEQMTPWLQSPAQLLNDIKSEHGLATLARCQPDLIISIRYGVILNNAVIQQSRLGVLNLHSGKLPDYRGVMATFWAMLNSEAYAGTTLHYIQNSRIDEGDIIASTELAIDNNKSYLWHLLELYPDGCEAILTAVKRIEQSESIITRPQPDTGHYYSYPTIDDLELFKNKGLKLYDATEVMPFLRRYLD
ncbi:formyl transferase [Pleionea mediterranea]|jgi:methionyl-tRNA formyltransferase|uniref:Methionyl-tRNA formyltransferase n=1 Tax=Pleionea mediterranea TaxID=523701 RepID=A0A316G141_9GAMM|nr:formyl transferase [Pleionea mediterranea]PWK53686.1 methionyl-tRNA formyltransferase [Pleionea mediterranea]